MAKRYERRVAAAQALGIDLDGKPMHELRELLEADAGATERYAEIVGTTPRPEPTPDPVPASTPPAATPAKRATRKAAKSTTKVDTKLYNPGDALKAALATANASMNGVTDVAA